MNILPFGGVGSCVEVANTQNYSLYIPAQTSQTVVFDSPVDLEKTLITLNLHTVTSSTDGRASAFTFTLYLKNGVSYSPKNAPITVKATPTDITIASSLAYANRQATITLEELDVDVEITEHTASRRNNLSWGYAGSISLPIKIKNTFLVVDSTATVGAGTLIKVRDVDVDKDKNTHISSNDSSGNYWHSMRIATATTVEAVGNATGTEYFRIVKFLV